MNANHILHIFMKGSHMNFSQLQSFIALAETGSFTEAAFAINLTQSAVSHALASLENELGVTLFERNRKGIVALTGVGQRIMPHARSLLAQAEAIEQEARTEQGRAAGKLRLGNTLSLCPNLLASVLTRFQRLYPDIEVVLFEGSMLEVSEWINSSIIDVGFMLLPEKGLESTLITTDELCVVVPPGHRLQARGVVNAGDLLAESFVMAKMSCAYALLEMAGLDLNRSKSLIRYQASDSATVLAMIREGLGITLLPRMMLPKKLDGVVALPLDPAQPLPIGLGVKSRATAVPGARLFIQTALDWIQEDAA